MRTILDPAAATAGALCIAPERDSGQRLVTLAAMRRERMVPIEFETHPERYKHWKLSVDGRVATLVLDVQENEPLHDGYVLKLNSYDLGVDIELADVVQRLRFEHPEVGAVVFRSAKDRVFSAGANIQMLGRSSHAFKVNFCKFTNETRLGRRLRAGARLRPDPAHRRRQLGGQPAGGAASGCAAGHRRPHTRGRQAQSAS